MDPGCIFCRIVTGEVPAQIAYQDDYAVAFYDIRPVAPVHLVVVPRRHLVPPDAFNEADALGHLLEAAARAAASEGIAATGYRLVINVGEDAGQEVQHLHAHLLGGRHLAWPPG
ncbi:MAG: histidine triad nucleotide-binding protein [Chthonomonadales bacterium]